MVTGQHGQYPTDYFWTVTSLSRSSFPTSETLYKEDLNPAIQMPTLEPFLPPHLYHPNQPLDSPSVCVFRYAGYLSLTLSHRSDMISQNKTPTNQQPSVGSEMSTSRSPSSTLPVDSKPRPFSSYRGVLHRQSTARSR